VGQEVADLEHSQKFMKEESATIVPQTRMTKGDGGISGRSVHFGLS
jgi:hypothetical protein